jgi:hypothetical protein
MLEKSKIKYFSYYFLLLPFVLGALYISIQFLVVYCIFKDSNYDTLFTIASCLLLSLITLGLTLYFKERSQFVKDFSEYVIILYISCLLSFIIHLWRFNFGTIRRCPYNFDISETENLYNLTIIFTTIINVIFFYIIKYNRLKFKKLHVILFVLAMIAQFFFTRHFRMI